MQTPEELQNAFGFLYPDELAELRRLALALPPNPVIVNIGAGVGTSAATFLAARQDCILFTIDINPGISPHGGLGNEAGVLKEMGLLKGDRYGYFQIAGDSKAVAKDWRLHWPIDLVFVDGDHTYEGAAGDLLGWFPFLKPGGFISIHDYGKAFHYLKMAGLPDTTPITEEILQASKAYPGVDQAVMDILLTPRAGITLVTANYAERVQLIGHIDSLITFQKLQT